MGCGNCKCESDDVEMGPIDPNALVFQMVDELNVDINNIFVLSLMMKREYESVIDADVKDIAVMLFKRANKIIDNLETVKPCYLKSSVSSILESVHIITGNDIEGLVLDVVDEVESIAHRLTSIVKKTLADN